MQYACSGGTGRICPFFSREKEHELQLTCAKLALLQFRLDFVSLVFAVCTGELRPVSCLTGNASRYRQLAHTTLDEV